MKIQFLGGGLANQIRQYVFVRGQERLHPGEQWIYDDSCIVCQPPSSFCKHIKVFAV